MIPIKKISILFAGVLALNASNIKNFNFPDNNSYKYQMVFNESLKYDKLDDNIEQVREKGKILYKYPLLIKGYIRDDYYNNRKDRDFYLMYLPKGVYKVNVKYDQKLTPIIGIFNENFVIQNFYSYAKDEIKDNEMSFKVYRDYNGFLFLGIMDNDQNLFKKGSYKIKIYLVKRYNNGKLKKADSLPDKEIDIQGYLRRKLNQIRIERYNKKEKERYQEYKNFKETVPFSKPDMTYEGE